MFLGRSCLPFTLMVLYVSLRSAPSAPDSNGSLAAHVGYTGTVTQEQLGKRKNCGWRLCVCSRRYRDKRGRWESVRVRSSGVRGDKRWLKIAAGNASVSLNACRSQSGSMLRFDH